jgi:murein DD-endopeptidase MepM/ murein hydrolase activator NlpD
MHRSRALVLLFLSFIIVASSVAPASALSAADVQKHRTAASDARKKAAEAEARADQLREETVELDKRADQLRKEAAALEPQISDATTRTQKLNKEVEKLDSDVTALRAEIAATQAEYERQRELLTDRVQTAYKQGTWYYFDILLGSKNITDLIRRTELVNRVIESNNSVAMTLNETRESLSASEVKLARSLESLKVKRKEAENVEKNLRNLHSSRKSMAAQQQQVSAQKSQLMAAAEKDAERLKAMAADEERESKRIEAELAALARRSSGSSSAGSGIYTGTMAWPVPGFRYVSSGFGWRTHPIFKTRKFHTGIDIASGGGPSINGAAIVAVDAGTVFYTGYRGGYGNTVMIDHGNGIVTLYAHMQSGSISVSSGQVVSKGQRIGAVGSTGYSTGPHLHFEVRVNGAPQNPTGYLSGS